jgi:hypothetical protein
MADVRGKYVPPAIDKGAFNCPHCGAFAKQSWFNLHSQSIGEFTTPSLSTSGTFQAELSLAKIPALKKFLERSIKRIDEGLPVMKPHRQTTENILHNCFLSYCFSCYDVAIWIYNRLVWPQRGEAPLPNPDLPPEVRREYDEASTILHLSPRGAAALLRLCIQRLCKHLGGSGENINKDIAALVKNGLDPRVQQALDVVRVVGNNAVHPGQIDLRDDQATAENMFRLVNLIADIMISQQKHLSEMYANLPDGARKAIEKRDGK